MTQYLEWPAGVSPDTFGSVITDSCIYRHIILWIKRPASIGSATEAEPGS